jgi:hypothetical protein
MNIIPAITMRTLMAQIVEATHGLCNEIGEPKIVNTIPEERMRMAALVAIQIAIGEEAMPNDRGKLVIKRPRTTYGLIVEEAS